MSPEPWSTTTLRPLRGPQAKVARCVLLCSSSSRTALVLFSKLPQISSQLTHLGSRPALVRNKHLQKMAWNSAPNSFKDASSGEDTPSTVERGRWRLFLARRSICGTSTWVPEDLVSSANEVDLPPPSLLFSSPIEMRPTAFPS